VPTPALVALGYAALLVAAALLAFLARRTRIPAAVLVVAAGLALGRSGFRVVDPGWLPPLLWPVSFHLALVLAALGWQMGRGLLRLPAWEVVRRSVPPLLLAALALGAAMAVLPRLLPDLYPDRSFRRFMLPLSFVFATFPLLAVRDLRGKPPADVGNVFLVAIALVGAVTSFAPPFLWSPHIDLGVVWRGPTLILGESGALGVLSAVLFLFLTRRLRFLRRLTGSAIFLALAWLCPGLLLWFPFAALGYGIVLGRAGEARLPLPGAGTSAPYSELPFALLAALAFAPDLWLHSLVLPSLLHAAFLCVLVLLVRAKVPGGTRLVTGPGLLFLGLTLAVRLDARMGPLTHTTVDFALPAWLTVRAVVGVAQRWGERRTPSAVA